MSARGAESVSRVACLLVPAFPLAALLRAEPALRDQPVAVADGPGARAGVLAANRAARRHGVRCGMTAVQARSLVPGLTLRPVSQALVRSAQAALADAARAFSPRVGLGEPGPDGAPCPGGDGQVSLDVTGLGRRHPDEGRLAAALGRAAAAVGLPARVGIGSGLLVARLAAATADADVARQVIAAGGERAFLDPLPVSLLPASARLQAALERFGIERLGQLAALPSAGLGRRLGPEGLALWRLANGQDSRPLIADPAPERFREEIEPGWALDRLEPLLAELAALFARLAERLACRGLAAQGVEIAFDLDPDGRTERRVGLAAPNREAGAWLDAVRLVLEREPPPAPVAGLAVEALPARLRAGQLDFFTRGGLVPSRQLDDALARLVALAGDGRVGSPRLSDDHHPDRIETVPLGEGGGVAAPGPPPVPLRVLRPACAAEVRLRHGRPVQVHAGPFGGQVRACAGPWRLSSGWWRAEPVARDYYDVELSDGGVYRIYQERHSQAWFMDGICG